MGANQVPFGVPADVIIGLNCGAVRSAVQERKCLTEIPSCQSQFGAEHFDAPQPEPIRLRYVGESPVDAISHVHSIGRAVVIQRQPRLLPASGGQFVRVEPLHLRVTRNRMSNPLQACLYFAHPAQRHTETDLCPDHLRMFRAKTFTVSSIYGG